MTVYAGDADERRPAGERNTQAAIALGRPLQGIRLSEDLEEETPAGQESRRDAARVAWRGSELPDVNELLTRIIGGTADGGPVPGRIEPSAPGAQPGNPAQSGLGRPIRRRD